MSIFSIFKRKKKKKQKETKKQQNQQNKSKDKSGQADDIPKDQLGTSLTDNIQMIKDTTGNSTDIVIRQIEMGQMQLAIVMTDGLIDDATVNEFILDPILQDQELQKYANVKSIINDLEKKILPICNITAVNKWEDFFNKVLSGESLILIDGVNTALSVSTSGGEKRSVSEPQTEVSIRGPRESFTENIRTNTSLIRRRIKNPNLWLESMQIGTVSKTDVGIMYIKGIANDQIVQEVRDRLNRIDIDAIQESAYIEEFIEDQTFTNFPTIYHSERPDVVVSNLLQGKIAILVNGTPVVLTVPALFVEFFQAVDDYYTRFDFSIFIRLLRISVFFISLLGPSLYVAVTTYHQEMVPTLLILTLAAQREVVPFPTVVEALLMEVVFEILREAGVRLPKQIGQTVSIVGALVIGQAAVEAGIVSPAMVIVVAITAIASFATPAYAIGIAARIIRFGLIFLSAFMGVYGILIGLSFMFIHLCSMRSFGVPYLAPLGPLMPKNIGDTIIRLPLWAMKLRPKLISQKNIKRIGDNQELGPPNSNR